MSAEQSSKHCAGHDPITPSVDISYGSCSHPESILPQLVQSLMARRRVRTYRMINIPDEEQDSLLPLIV